MDSCNGCDAIDELNDDGYCFACQIEIAKANPDAGYICLFCLRPSKEPHTDDCKMGLAKRYYDGKVPFEDPDFEACEKAYDVIAGSGLELGWLKISMRTKPGKPLSPEITGLGAMALVTMQTREFEDNTCEGCGRYHAGGTAHGVILQEHDNIDANWLIWVFPEGFSVSDESANGPIAACSDCQASPVIKTLRFDGAKSDLVVYDLAE